MESNQQGVGVRLRGVTLRLPTFVQHQNKNDSWVRTLLGAAVDRPERRLHTILSNIDFELNDGDRVALIGRNGAGKTSLLHVLTGCYLPTDGSVEITGTRQALLNVTLGFNPEATVRENIFLRGSAMGMPMNAVRDSVGSILEFAGLETLAGQRLGTLSAGQRMRLGFAISTSVQPDIMLLDEWIGAGDAEFLQRARERMQDRVMGSRIMVLASHSVDLLSRVCTRGLVLEGGELQFDGPIKPALAFYRQSLHLSRPAPAGTVAPIEFQRRSLAHAKRYGVEFSHPVHCLFENRQLHSDGTSDYGFLTEVESVSVSQALAQLADRLLQRGLQLSGYEGAGLPNVFHFVGPAGARASVTLTAYGTRDARQAPAATGRLHVNMTGCTE